MYRFDRQRAAQGKLFKYASYKALIAEYEARALSQTRKCDTQYIKGAYRSDPAARGGVMLADPPHRIQIRMAWCSAIENAWAECKAEDAANGRSDVGMAYVMEEYFCLNKPPRDKEKNGEAREAMRKRCDISTRTFYEWISEIVDTVVYHAAKQNLL